MTKDKAGMVTSLQRGLGLLRILSGGEATGMRLSQIAKAANLTEATTHRLLKTMIDAGFVEQGDGRLYCLSIDFFALAATAGNPHNLRDICRPSLMHLSATLNDTVFLLVRSGFHAVCVDRAEGPFPIRSFTGDIGGRIPLGVGQGALVILAFLPPEERDAVIHFNLSRLLDIGPYDEVYLRTEIDRVVATGYCARETGVIPGMTGVAVPVFDTSGRVVAALSVGTLSERLRDDRLPVVVDLLRREAERISAKVSPFDSALRRPAQYLGGIVSGNRVDPAGQRSA
jgi:DNA-binding IclR family transcriptional regulator